MNSDKLEVIDDQEDLVRNNTLLSDTGGSISVQVAIKDADSTDCTAERCFEEPLSNVADTNNTSLDGINISHSEDVAAAAAAVAAAQLSKNEDNGALVEEALAAVASTEALVALEQTIKTEGTNTETKVESTVNSSIISVISELETTNSFVVDTANADAAAVAGNIANAVLVATCTAPSVAPLQPGPRDIVLELNSISTEQRISMLIHDLILLERVVRKLQGKPNPVNSEDVDEFVSRIVELVNYGKSIELAGIKDVPFPFMKSTGKFLSKDDSSWRLCTDDEARSIVTKMVLSELSKDDLGNFDGVPYSAVKDMFTAQTPEIEADLGPITPDVHDPVLLRCCDSPGDKLYEQYSGNKEFFNLASQLVNWTTKTSVKRLEAALAIISRLADIAKGQRKGGAGDKESSSIMSRHPRFLIRTPKADDSVVWEVLTPIKAAEFCVVFVFEVFLEKKICTIESNNQQTNEVASSENADQANPSTKAIQDPTDHDVLFGRGGMTNSHPGNRRFRDIIALHRPDYVRAIKMDKPAVAKKIVKAIRTGNPPGRFLKKNDNGFWYDVGDRTAAEKTSQGLRERTNAEKRLRSAFRDSVRTRKQDVPDEERVSNKKVKTEEKIAAQAEQIVPPTPATVSPVDAGDLLSAKPMTKGSATAAAALAKQEDVKEDKASFSGLNTAGLPPNAVDKDGNILVTDYDILCGRGGLTNHHKGNKRFRDIVALHRSDYVRAPKIQKPAVARVIVRAIRNGDPPGRFIKKNEKTGKWYDVGDKKAAEKTSQALREKTNEERDQTRQQSNAPASSTVDGETTERGTTFDPEKLMVEIATTVATIPASDSYMALTQEGTVVVTEAAGLVPSVSGPDPVSALSVVVKTSTSETTTVKMEDEVDEKISV